MTLSRTTWLLAALGGVVALVLLVVAWLHGARAGQGTLVVAVDDAALEVTVAGQGVVRQVTGPEELHLPAGRYEVWCSGKARPGRSLWVDVPAGGTAEASPPSPVPVRPPPRPFVVLARGDEE